jgi:hypothetical protein
VAVAEVVGVAVAVAVVAAVGKAMGQRMALEKRDHIKCFKCHNYGHYANRCPGEKEEEAHHARAVEFEPTVLLVETAELGLLEHPLSDECQEEVFLNEVKVHPESHFTGDGEPCGDIWYMDNGASNHMIGDLHKFRDIDTTVSGKVCFGDSLAVEIQGKESILFQGISSD